MAKLARRALLSVLGILAIPTLVLAFPFINTGAKFNVKNYGAVGDDVTDDGAAIMLAEAAVRAAAQPGVIYFPQGKYKISGASLTFNVDLETILGDNAILDFSGLATNSVAAVVLTGSGINSYQGNPYYNTDKYFQGMTLIGNSTSSATSGLFIYSTAEPGPAHIAVKDTTITQFGIGVTISSNAYILDFDHVSTWVDGLCYNVPNTTNSGERIVVHNGGCFNSSTGTILNNGNADFYTDHQSWDGISNLIFDHRAGGLLTEHCHIENTFAPSYTGLQIEVTPASASNLFSSHVNDWILIKSTHSAPAFEYKGPSIVYFYGDHIDGTALVSTATIQADPAGGFYHVDVDNRMNDTLFNNVKNSEAYFKNNSQVSIGAPLYTAQFLGLIASTTSDNAASTYVGYSTSSAIFPATAVSATGSTQWTDITNVAFTGGDWDVAYTVCMTLNGATATTFAGGFGTTSGNSDPGSLGQQSMAADPATTANDHCISGATRYSVATAGANFYLKGKATYSAGTPKFYGSIFPKRIR